MPREKLDEIARQLTDSPISLRLDLIESLVRSLFGTARKKRMMRPGMFKGPRMSTEADFEMAEWRLGAGSERG